MTAGELELLSRAHALFDGAPESPVGATHHDMPPVREFVGAPTAYRETAAQHRAELAGARGVDAELSAILAQAHREHHEAQRRTGAVLNAARADAATVPDNPVAQRELLRRRAARLRAQHAHVHTARRRARRRAALLRTLRYRLRGRGRRLPLPDSRAGVAVRAALSRLGCPYVWGATGPDRFDCSGLVQWAYARAGVHLDRTTYDQINNGVPVPRSQVRPGDLVFPHAGHVQLAIGNNLVVEAPHAGADVRVSTLGTHVAIRRPL